ncbi:MAG TPA: hypothetical protein VGA35_11010 [bacterium]
MPLGDVLHAINQLKDVAGILGVRDIVATVKCERRARDGTTQRVIIEIFHRTPSLANRYEIQAKVGSKSAAGKGNSLDEALRSVHWQTLDYG